MFRTFILPVILMGLVGGPMLYSHHQRRSQRGLAAGNPAAVNNSGSFNPWQQASYQGAGRSASALPPVARTAFPGTTTFPGTAFYPGQATPQSTSFPVSANHQVNRSALGTAPFSITNPNGSQALYSGSQTIPGAPVIASPVSYNQNAWTAPGLTPDFAKTETLVFSGDANGPDLSAGPMSFTPTIDIASLFRFDISESWVTQRWQRVSTSPADQGLHGLRVALVTGTNSWDLHGALTYYFDPAHRLQRITYRGWTGDANRLLQILQQQHQLKAQPTHWAGVYLSKRSGLLMKHPAVIDKSNAVQQLALILELNNPAGSNNLSEDFQNLSRAAVVSR